MSTLTTIETPERVALTYDLAGLGTRVIAYLVDLGIRVGVVMLVMVAVVATLGQMELDHRPSWLLTGGVVGFFLLQWGYSALFEGFWNGQTPGKRLMSIRVIEDGGYPCNFFDATVRSLIAVVDFLPAMYAIGMLCIFFSRRHQRLGDIVAGTLVVRQRREPPPTLAEILAAHGESSADRQTTSAAARLDLPVTQFEAVVEFLERAAGISETDRRRIAAKFAEPIRMKIAGSKALRRRYPIEELDDLELLRRVIRTDRKTAAEKESADDGESPHAGSSHAGAPAPEGPPHDD